MDLAYPPRRLRIAGNTLLILGPMILAGGVSLLEFGNPNVEGEHFVPGLLVVFVGILLAATGGCLRLMARLGSR